MDTSAVRTVRTLGALVGVAIGVSACAGAGIRAIGSGYPSCTQVMPPRWVAEQRSADREVRVTIDADPDTRDGWRSDGGRRLRIALAHWNSLSLPVKLVPAMSPRDADITVQVIQSFPVTQPSSPLDKYRAGLTKLTYREGGEITRAVILIAETTPFGQRYTVSDQLATLMHELGHALGLPHVVNPDALMAARPRAESVTAIDATLARTVYGPTGCPGVQLAAGDDFPGLR